MRRRLPPLVRSLHIEPAASSVRRPELAFLSTRPILFRLKLFGSASIEGPEGPVTGRAVQRRRLALLALLALARERGLTRDKLIGYLWPDSDTERARHLLSDSVYRINQAVGGEAILSVGDDLRLNPQRLPADAWEFADAIDRREWVRAAELHAAPFLDGFFLTDAEELEKWVEVQREHLARERARAIEQLALAAESADAAGEAVRWWRLLAAQDPFSSRIALRLMRALERSGDRAAALQHAGVHTALLRAELGLAPDAELSAFVDELRRPPPPHRAGHAAAAAPHPPHAGGGRDDVAHDWSPGQPAAHGPTPTGVATGAPKPVRRPNPARFAIAAAALIALLAIAAYFWMRNAGDDAAPAIVVLPFADLGADSMNAYFADGITEELIARLGQVEGLRVVGRTSAFAFRNRTPSLADVARQLGVTSVIEGSVRRAGDRVRIVAQLSDARTGYQIWTETYEREAADVFAIQDEIAREIVTRIRRGSRGADAELPVLAGATEDAEAFNLYLQGRWNWHRRTQQNLFAAVDFFRRAVERAPDYARAHAGLGDTYAVLGFYDFLPPREAFPAAAAAARRALELEPSLAAPHATLAYVALYYEWDWDDAEREFRRAIELDPGYSTAYQWYANLLTAMGRFDEAVSTMSDAMRLDPLSLIANAALCWSYHHGGEYVSAIAQCTRALELDSAFALASLWRGWAREELGDVEAAIDDYEHAVRISPSANHVAALARGHARAGDHERARALLAGLRSRSPSGYVPPYELVRIHEALGDVDAAMAALDAAYRDRSHSMVFLAVDPQLKGLRGDARFRALVKRLRLDRTPGASWLDG